MVYIKRWSEFQIVNSEEYREGGTPNKAKYLSIEDINTKINEIETEKDGLSATGKAIKDIRIDELNKLVGRC